MWNKTITLYNKHEDKQTGIIKWHRHEIEGCFYKITDKKLNAGNTQLKTSDSIIRIPEQKNYLPPYEWLKLPDNKIDDCFTLQTGDLIFLGAVKDDIDEYTQGKRSNDLVKKYSSFGSVFIKTVTINDFMPGTHYLVRGD